MTSPRITVVFGLLPQNAADRRADLARRQDRSRHLVEEGLKQVVIGAVDQNDLRRASA